MFDPKLDVEIVVPGECRICGKPEMIPGFCKDCVVSIANDVDFDSPPPRAPDSPSFVKQEMAERELCRRRLIPFVKRLRPTYKAGWFHKDLAARLERFVKRVEEGLSPRMIITVPPRRGKSELASKALPAWFLGRNPNKSVIAATHSDRLAMDNSRDVLNYIKEPAFNTVFPRLALNKDNKGATGWRTDDGGIYKPVGVGGGIAGYGADILIIDDPHRDQDAYSETVRAGVWRWYQSSASTRLMPGGGILVIQTRWVLDDLAGTLMSEEGLITNGGKWELVCYPEEAVEDEYRLPNGNIIHVPDPTATLLRRKGDCLHPERYPPESNLQYKQDPRTWAALYQQNPLAGEAAMFMRDWFPDVSMDDIPARLTHYSTWDTAVSQSEHAAFTAGIVGGVDVEDNLWIVDVIRGRWDGMDIVETILDTYLKYRETLTGIERTNHQVAIKPFMDKRVVERKAFGINVVDLLHENKDKTARARPIQARCRQGKVMIPRDAPWYDDLMKEIMEFPVGRYKDMVDALAHMGQLLDTMTSPYTQTSKAPTSWRDKVASRPRNRNWRAA